MIERKNYGLTPLCESGKGKFISGAADFGLHTRQQLLVFFTTIHPFFPEMDLN